MVTPHLNELELRAGDTSGVQQKVSWMTLMEGVYSAESMLMLLHPVGHVLIVAKEIGQHWLQSVEWGMQLQFPPCTLL